MDISVIIPTYNRALDLEECLRSILTQTVPPSEVLVVDNSDSGAGEIRRAVERVGTQFSATAIALRYVRNPRENSLTVAKNLGIDLSGGAVVSFLDDDVVLDPRYYEAILDVYQTHPHALGVEGAVVAGRPRNPIAFGLEQALGRIFFLGFREDARCRVLPSLAVTYPLRDELVTCEWLSGAATYRRRIFTEFRPDEKLRKYADNEDIDLSHRIFRKYPGTLFFTPGAKYAHKGSVRARVTGRERVYMQEVYRLYLLYRHVDVTPGNVLIYLWSRVGRMVYLLGRATVRLSGTDLREAGSLLGAWGLCLRHRRAIRDGDLDFFDRYLG